MTDNAEYKCCICGIPLGRKYTVNKMIKANTVGYVKNKGTRYYHLSCLEKLGKGEIKIEK